MTSDAPEYCNTLKENKAARLTLLIPLVIGLSLLLAITARAATENDFQQWSLIYVSHHLNDKWSASIQLENRLRDDASDVDK